jgi:hypothetical protein
LTLRWSTRPHATRRPTRLRPSAHEERTRLTQLENQANERAPADATRHPEASLLEAPNSRQNSFGDVRLRHELTLFWHLVLIGAVFPRRNDDLDHLPRTAAARRGAMEPDKRQGPGASRPTPWSHLGRSNRRGATPLRIIAVSFHRLFLGRLLPSRACFRFAGSTIYTSITRSWRNPARVTDGTPRTQRSTKGAPEDGGARHPLAHRNRRGKPPPPRFPLSLPWDAATMNI